MGKSILVRISVEEFEDGKEAGFPADSFATATFDEANAWRSWEEAKQHVLNFTTQPHAQWLADLINAKPPEGGPV